MSAGRSPWLTEREYHFLRILCPSGACRELTEADRIERAGRDCVEVLHGCSITQKRYMLARHVGGQWQSRDHKTRRLSSSYAFSYASTPEGLADLGIRTYGTKAAAVRSFPIVHCPAHDWANKGAEGGK